MRYEAMKLTQLLARAVADERYEEAATLRDRIAAGETEDIERRPLITIDEVIETLK